MLLFHVYGLSIKEEWLTPHIKPVGACRGVGKIIDAISLLRILLDKVEENEGANVKVFSQQEQQQEKRERKKERKKERIEIPSDYRSVFSPHGYYTQDTNKIVAPSVIVVVCLSIV